MLDTAAAARVLMGSVLGRRRLDCIGSGFGMSGKEVSALICWMAGAHDVGKASMGFQQLVPSAFENFSSLCGMLEEPTQQIPHEEFSELFVRKRFGDSAGSEFAGAVVRGHHGQFGPYPRWPEDWLAADPAGSSQEFIDAREALFGALKSGLGSEPSFEEIRPAKWFAAFSTGAVSICDWIVSDTRFLKSRLNLDLSDPAEYLEKSVAELRDRFTQLGVIRGGLDGRNFSELFPAFEPRGVQTVVDPKLADYIAQGNGPGGLCIVMAPTGEGKTEAGLAAASLLSKSSACPGLFFGLPTMATSDAMFERVSSFLDRKDASGLVTLNHSMAGMNVNYTSGELSSNDNETTQAAIRWLRGRHKGLFASNAVGTVDQLLAMTLPSKYGFMRHVGLAGKTVVVDEAHDYDAFMRALLARSLEWLGACRVPVVLLSATLPEGYVSQYLAAYQRGYGAEESDCKPTYPGVTAWIPGTEPVTFSADSSPTRINLLTCEYDRERGSRTAALVGAFGEFSEGCVAVICNTVRSAQDTFVELQEKLDDSIPIELLHSRLPMSERRERTQRIIDRYGKDGTRPQAGVVVATQVIEQSLDLDFDGLITELAPIAQLLQRAGRCHRHEGRTRPRGMETPQLKVLTPTEGGEFVPPIGWCFVYSKAELVKTAALIKERTSIAIPQDVQGLVNSVDEFNLAEGIDEGLRRAEMDRFASDSSDAHKAKLFAIPAPQSVAVFTQLTSAETEERLSTRLGSGSKLALFVTAEGGSLSFSDGSEVPQTNLTSKKIRNVLGYCCPVADRLGSWVNNMGEKRLLLGGWSDIGWLKDVVIVAALPGEEGALSAQIGEKLISLHPILGLMEEKVNAQV